VPKVKTEENEASNASEAKKEKKKINVLQLSFL
jgi:hypothetical protein